MKTVNSYFVKFANGTSAVLAVGKEPPADMVSYDVRPMLLPDDGLVLRHKETGDISSGHWLRNGDSADKWEEIEDEKMD
jgi:hypothetical protein